MNIIGYRKIYFLISGIFVGLGLFGIVFWGLNLGIDFTGGSLSEIEYTVERPETDKIYEKLSGLDIGDIAIQPIGDKGVLIRFKSVSEEKHQEVLSALRTKTLDLMVPQIDGEEYIGAPENNPENIVIEKRFDSIGPVIGQELKDKTVYAITIALMVIVAYIAWAFRKVSKPISSWKYGVIAIVALFHDVIIVVGIFVFLGRFFEVEINAPFVAALLTILGYSVNDTIVIFDRIRENLKNYNPDFEDVVNKSVNQNLVRSMYTSLTTLFVLFSLYFFGGETIKTFVLALIIGVISGTYSSIFLASPLLVVWEKFKFRKE